MILRKLSNSGAVFAVLLAVVTSVYSECEFDKYSSTESGIFLQELDGESTIVNFQGNFLRIPDQGHIEAVCNSGFRFPSHTKIFGSIDGKAGKDYEEYLNVSVLCHNSDLTYSFPGGLRQDVGGHVLICIDNRARFYQTQLAQCNAKGLLYGFTIKETMVIAAEICYDVDREKTLFIHFTGGKRTPLLEGQHIFNPSEAFAPLQTLKKFIFPKTAEMHSLLRIHTFPLPGYSMIADYKLDFLTPIANFTTIFGNLVNNYEFPNIVPFWTTLRNYNWRIFDELLRNEVARQNLDIYAGTSGTVTYPYDLRSNISAGFVITNQAMEIPVPLHLWYFVRSKNDTNAAIVIIAVNSPIVQVSLPAVICEDVCDAVSWLRPLATTRKIPALGYIYCCRPQSVASMLEGFPKTDIDLSRKSDTTTTTTLPTIVTKKPI